MKNATINHWIRQVKFLPHSQWNTRNYTALKDLQFNLTRTQRTTDMRTPIRELFTSTLKLEIVIGYYHNSYQQCLHKARRSLSIKSFLPTEFNPHKWCMGQTPLDISMNNVDLLPSRTADLPVQFITIKPVKETLQGEFPKRENS